MAQRRLTKLIRSKTGKLFRRAYYVSAANALLSSGLAHAGMGLGSNEGAKYYNRQSGSRNYRAVSAPLHYGVTGAVAGYYTAQAAKKRFGVGTRALVGVAGHAAGLYLNNRAFRNYRESLAADFGWVMHAAGAQHG